MRTEPPDPAMEPMDGTDRWIETGPDPILNDPDLAVLFVRVGMAANALSAQIQAGRDASRLRRGAAKTRDLLASMVTSVAYTNEAIRLAMENMKVLRSMAEAANVDADVLRRAGKLCAGEHPADRILKRARKNLGFHWDDEVVRRSVLEYGKNATLVWFETTDNQFTHRLASDVLAHALLFEVIGQTDDARAHESGVSAAFDDVKDAMRVLDELFSAAFSGFMQTCRGNSRERPVPPADKRVQ